VEKSLEEKLNKVNDAINAKERAAETEIQEKKMEDMANEEYEHIKEMAKRAAEKTIEVAKEKAQLIVQAAELKNKAAMGTGAAGGGGTCCTGCANPCANDAERKPKYEVADLVPLEPAKPPTFDTLGLDDQYSVDSEKFKQGEKLLNVADERHKEFQKRYEHDCKGPICPLSGQNVVVAELK
jgi:hypothetical protein